MSGEPLEHDDTEHGVEVEAPSTDRPGSDAAAGDGEARPAARSLDPDATLNVTDETEAIAAPVDEPEGAQEADGALADGEPETADVPGDVADDSGFDPEAAPPLAPDEETTVNMTSDPEATVNLIGDPEATVNLTGVDIPPAPERDDATVAHEVTRGHLKGLLEALIFASDKPIKTGELSKAASAPSKQVKELLEELRGDFSPRGMQLDEVAGGWIFRTNAAYAPFVRDLTKQKPVKLTRAQIETLAILAYRQPITRPEVDEIRGVDCGPVLKLLLERDLVRMLGRKDEPGRPVIYGTTVQFLELFGLKSLKDLPTLREFTDLNEESRRTVERELGETMEEAVGGGDEPARAHTSDTLPPSDHEAPMNTEIPPALPDMLAAGEEPAEISHDTPETPPASSEGDVAEEAPIADETQESAAHDTGADQDDAPKTRTGDEIDPEDEFPDDDDDDFDDDDEDEDDEDEDDEDSGDDAS